MNDAQMPTSGPLPHGTVTFLFTDVVGSTRIWEQAPAAAQQAMSRHDALIEQAVTANAGQLVRPRGEGDSRFAVFRRATDAVAAAHDIQLSFAAEPWPTPEPVRVRMALHSGEADLRAGDYYGSEVNRCARLRALAHGGQVLLSQASFVLARDALPSGVEIRDLGELQLKDLQRPEHVYQLVIPTLPSDFPPLVSLDARPNNLPPQLTSFIGRESEIKAVGNILGRTRLLTLTGPGGTGKTRLSLQIGTAMLDDFKDGVWFVDLSSVVDHALVVQTILRTLGVRDMGDRPALELLQNHLRNKEILLILDNFEQVIEAAPIIKELLVNAPGVKCLVTSRTALRVTGEQEHEVPQFTLPDPRHLPPLEQMSQYEAVQLFIERVRAYKSDWQITNENAPAVAEICYRLDGLPLAIELAAARVRLLTPEKMLAQLNTRLNFLTSPARDLPVRQQTLRGAIDWSYNLLSNEERALFSTLAVFVGGATLEAIEPVCNPAGQLETLTAIESLVDKSLLRQTEAFGEPRFLMLETIREYATARLAENAELAAATCRAHAAYFAEMTASQWDRLMGEQREAAIQALVGDLDNVRSGWRYWATAKDLTQLGKFFDTLWVLYDARGWYQAIVDLTADLLQVLSFAEASPEHTSQEITLQTSLARALLAIKGYTPEVERAYTRALDLCQKQGRIPQLFPVLRGLSSFYIYLGEFDKSAQMGEQILQLAESLDDENMRAEGHLVVGASTLQHRSTLEHLEKAIAGFNPTRGRAGRLRLGPNPGVSSLTTSAITHYMYGFPDRAIQRAGEAVALARQLDHPFSLCYALFHSGYLHLWLGQPEISGARARDTIRIAEEHDFQVWLAVGTCLQGISMARLGSPEEGLTLIERGIASYRELRTPPVFFTLLIHMQAEALGLAHRPQEGLALLMQVQQMASASTGGGFEAMFQMLGGELLVAASPENRAQAESVFQQVIAISTKENMPTLELRAALALFQLWQGRARAGEGRQLLSAAYGRMTEGFTTPDMKQARALLNIKAVNG